MIYKANAGHPGGSLSAADIVTALYFHVMQIDPQNPNWEARDRFILSKGHACPVWYAALAEKGYFDMVHLNTLRKFHSILQGHPDMQKTTGIDMTSGSLGNGLSVGIGMALAAKRNRLNYCVYVLLGDGEIQEGIVWEAAMSAAHYRLDNLIAIVDYNGLQVDGWTKEVMDIHPVVEKWEAFGWNTIEIDGHNMIEILDAFQKAHKIKGPVVIVAHTVKGKGVSFMENVAVWHGLAPNDDQVKQALAELEKEAE
ncbi:MAG: transketolase [Firmicutes bacterium]|nr:transketolase [Bacillota bacterium]